MSKDLKTAKAELDQARAAHADWVRRGSPESEKDAINAALEQAGAAVAQAVQDAPIDPQHGGDSGHHGGGKRHGKHGGKRRHHDAGGTGGVNPADLNRETDARFYAQTGYKPGQTLDMKDPGDRAMANAWKNIHDFVVAEARGGTFQRTYADPKVRELLDRADVAYTAMIGALVGAKQARDQAHKDAQIAHATFAREQCVKLTQEAAQLQPPSIDPTVLKASLAAVESLGTGGPVTSPPNISGEDGGGGPVTKPELQPPGPVTSPDLNPMPNPPPDAPTNLPPPVNWAENAQTVAPMSPPPPSMTKPQGGETQMLAPEDDPWDERYKGRRADPVAPDPHAPHTAPVPTHTPPPMVDVRMPGPQAPQAPTMTTPPPHTHGGGGGTWADRANEVPPGGAPARVAPKPSGSPRGRAHAQYSRAPQAQPQGQPQPQVHTSGSDNTGWIVAGIFGVLGLGGALALARRGGR